MSQNVQKMPLNVSQYGQNITTLFGQKLSKGENYAIDLAVIAQQTIVHRRKGDVHAWVLTGPPTRNTCMSGPNPSATGVITK